MAKTPMKTQSYIFGVKRPIMNFINNLGSIINTNAAGEKLYYIQVRKSSLWIGLQSNGKIQNGTKIAQVSKSNRKLWRITAGKGEAVVVMPHSESVHITLADNLSLRWNVNDAATQANVLHLDKLSGSHCKFDLYPTGDGFYGIKHNRDDGIDYFVDVEDKSMSKDSVLHLWVLSNFAQLNRQFSFHEAGEDEHTGRMTYYIQARHSGLWIGTQYNKKPSLDDRVNLAQVEKKIDLLFI